MLSGVRSVLKSVQSKLFMIVMTSIFFNTFIVTITLAVFWYTLVIPVLKLLMQSFFESPHRNH